MDYVKGCDTYSKQRGQEWDLTLGSSFFITE